MDDEIKCEMDEKTAKAGAARRRYTLQTGKLANDTDVIAFLCDEIEYCRDKIKKVPGAITIEFLEKELRRCQDKIKEKDKRINELILQCDALTKKAPAQELTTERVADSGIMTLVTHLEYERVQDVLLRNGYFVCSHFDDETTEDETITIEYWRG